MRPRDAGTLVGVLHWRPMSARVRKLIGGIAILAFLLLYVGLALIVSDHLPDNWVARTAFFFVVGTAWGVPLFPLLTWMNRGR